MNVDRIKEIQQETAYPESRSVQQALLKVWNETAQSLKTAQAEASLLATAGNTVNALASLISGIANGKREDLLRIDLQNAKDQFEILDKEMQK